MEHTTAEIVVTGILHNLKKKNRNLQNVQDNDAYVAGRVNAYSEVIEYLHDLSKTIQRSKALHESNLTGSSYDYPQH